MESAAVGKKVDIQAVEEVDIQVVVERGMRLDTIVDILVEVVEGHLDRKENTYKIQYCKGQNEPTNKTSNRMVSIWNKCMNDNH